MVVIAQAIESYSQRKQPLQELNRVIIDEVVPGDEAYYKKTIKNSKYNRFKLSTQDVEKLNQQDRYQFAEKANAIIRISDELYYSNDSEYMIYYQVNELGGGVSYRLHFKKNNHRFEVIDNVQEIIYKE